jgi:GNAT superfamily N-acetyltransferase
LELCETTFGGFMTEKRFIYRGKQFLDVNIEPVNYSPSFLQMELDLESDVFYELRLANGILPVRINESTSEQLDEIKSFFLKNKDTFYFLFSSDQELIASILHLNNYIQALSVSKKYQRQGYGEQLSKYCINRILVNGYSSVELNVLAGNDRAEKLYRKLGFVEVP